jgi:HSP20 family protein
MGHLTRFDPYRFLDDTYTSPMSWRFFQGWALTPLVDVHQTDDTVTVTVSLPGVKPDDVSLTLSGRILSIAGELKEDEQVDTERYVYRERRVGEFNRRIQLPARVVGDQSEATFENGLLRVTFPKAEESKARPIEIKVPTTA